MNRIILLFLFLHGCFSSERYTHGISVDFWETPNQDLGTRIVEDYCRLATGLYLDLTTEIGWTTTLCLSEVSGDYKTAVIYRDVCYAGLTFNIDDIYVAWRGTLGESAFAHELGHIFKIKLGIDPDGQHLDTTFWNAMEAASFELQLEGL